MSKVQSTKNQDKLEKLLRQNLHGIKITDAAKKLGVHRSTIYKYLNSLDLRGRAHYERGIAYPGPDKCSTEAKSSKSGLFGRLNKRAERKRRKFSKEEKEERERLARFYTLSEHVANTWPIFKPLQEYADNLKKHRKELGLE